jgi:hypothetical protein
VFLNSDELKIKDCQGLKMNQNFFRNATSKSPFLATGSPNVQRGTTISYPVSILKTTQIILWD